MADRSVLELNGNWFERVVHQYLLESYPEAKLIFGKKLYSKYLEKETQIDLIMVHPNAVIVLEVKAWQKWIKGNYNDSHWFGQSSGVNVMKTISPIDQNFLHVRALRNAIRRKGVNPSMFYSVICLPDGTDIISDCKELCNLSRVKTFINGVLQKSTLCMDVNNMIDCITTIR